ncbi:hypothetical protein ITP31_004766 [Salmonella enterica]|nr:hypothetical protein [Salmonella enterica]
MKVNVELVDGKIDKIELIKDGVALFTVTRWQQEGLGLVAYNGTSLDLYYIYRHEVARAQEKRFRYGLDVIASRLLKYHGLTFKGLFWGIPVSTEYLNDLWYGLGNTLIMSNTGVLSDSLKDAMVRTKCTDALTDDLLTKVRLYVNY